jgi:hypothetical protein
MSPEPPKTNESPDATQAATADSSLIEWIEPEDGVCEVYANVIHVNWTAYDVRLRLGQLIADPRTSPQHAKWVVQEHAAVTMAYGQAKYLRNLLHGIILDYEAKNGDLKLPTLPTPTSLVEPK